MVLLCVCYSDIVHWYHSKENDWGYGNFMAWQVMNYVISGKFEYHTVQ